MENKKSALEHILKAILIALCISLLYAMVAFNLITGMYAELFNFFVTIGLFIGIIIFYFIVLFFKSIKR
ncbi:hypothetical protein [Flavobacterium chilense]|uniref:Uncharacterized protein n=1 Tax=Flavobacterium chilense TaxID=946677 RepID=A0A1M6Z587_9FLAO|nr:MULTISPECIES: hypothetical protein [Flavobacterium]SHL25580.1 hypothetical protein SAMN05444484_101882 [Flavobacterium chilense]